MCRKWAILLLDDGGTKHIESEIHKCQGSAYFEKTRPWQVTQSFRYQYLPMNFLSLLNNDMPIAPVGIAQIFILPLPPVADAILFMFSTSQCHSYFKRCWIFWKKMGDTHKYHQCQRQPSLHIMLSKVLVMISGWSQNCGCALTSVHIHASNKLIFEHDS